MSDLIVRTDIRSEHIEALLKAAGPRAGVGIARALNRTGAPTSAAYLRSVKAILGLRNWRYGKTSVNDMLKRKTSTRKATAARLTFSLAGFGKGLNLAYYQPKETPAGATVNWLGSRRLIARSFYLGGQFPKRVRSRISHSVWQRIGSGRWALAKPVGPGVPEAMIQSAPKAVWEANAASRLPAHLARELTAIIAGHA